MKVLMGIRGSLNETQIFPVKVVRRNTAQVNCESGAWSPARGKGDLPLQVAAFGGPLLARVYLAGVGGLLTLTIFSLFVVD